MDSPSIVVRGQVPVVDSIDRGAFRADIGAPVLPSEGRSTKISSAHLPVSRRPVSQAQATHEQPAVGSAACTLRVKPDRRRMQVQIPAGADRRGAERRA